MRKRDCGSRHGVHRMDRNLIDMTVADTAAALAWTAPQIVEIEIEAITAAGAGGANDGVTTAS